MRIYGYKEFGADFLLLLAALAWGGTFFIVQDAVKEVPIYSFLFWRFGLSAVIMAILSYKALLSINAESLRAGIVLGVFMFLGFAFQTFGLAFTYSSTVAFITGLNVIIVPFILFVAFKKRISLFSVIGALLSALGLYLLTFNGDIGFKKGEMLSLVCAFMFALHIVFTDLYSKKFDIKSLVCVQFVTVAALSLIFSVLSDEDAVPTFSPVFVKALIITVIFATIFAFWVQTSMQRFTTPVKTAVIFTLEPVSAGVFGYYFKGEELGAKEILGAFLILFAMLTVEIGSYLRRLYAKSDN